MNTSNTHFSSRFSCPCWYYWNTHSRRPRKFLVSEDFWVLLGLPAVADFSYSSECWLKTLWSSRKPSKSQYSFLASDETVSWLRMRGIAQTTSWGLAILNRTSLMFKVSEGLIEGAIGGSIALWSLLTIDPQQITWAAWIAWSLSSMLTYTLSYPGALKARWLLSDLCCSRHSYLRTLTPLVEGIHFHPFK